MSASTTIRLRNPSSLYFGKIASRGDFVKSPSGANVIALIDQWIAQGMEMLIAYPGWKAYYDEAGAIDFLLIATRKKHAICGCLMPSVDASSRRFPFIGATLFETEDALDFLPCSPLMLERHLGHQRALVHHASKTHDAADVLAKLVAVPFETEPAQGHALEPYDNFLNNTSVAALARMLALKDGHAVVRRMVLATGFLLQPILTNYAIPPQKGIVMPLPRDPAHLTLVKALWLNLVAIFLPRADFDLSVFSCVHYGRPKLIVAFNGTTPSVFRALFEEQAAHEQLIDISESDWVDDYVRQDPATLKLSSYLEHEGLSLRQMVETFRQGFSG